MVTRKAAGLLDRSSGLPDTFWYTTKRRLLGPPLVNQDLGEQRLSKPLALGVLSPDGISSSAYGTEEILIVLVPALGIAAFSLILPMTLVILFVMVLVLLSYREIVMVYIRPGGSYVVARENFGPRIAQVCAVALLIDYVVTVAVQVAAGTAAVASAFPGIGPYKLEICGHVRHKEPGWRYKFVINFSAGLMTLIVVAIFAVVKFTEGAWVVVVLFAVLVPALIRMNREYTAETEVLETISEHQPPPPPHYSRRTVFVFVDDFDLATLAALRYARSMRPTTIRAVHFVIDNVRADKLREKWTRADRGVTLDFIDCSDRRLTRAAAELVEREAADLGTYVTVVLPRRSYSALLGRLLHDRTADKIAAVVSRIPRAAATIIPYDVESRVQVLAERQVAKVAATAPDTTVRARHL